MYPGLSDARDWLEGFFGEAVSLSIALIFSPVNFRIFTHSTGLNYGLPNHDSERVSLLSLSLFSIWLCHAACAILVP